MVVYIVGAGPGDPELLTLKAKRLIESAEVLAYDKLVSKEILNWAPPECQLVYVGKRAPVSAPSQEVQKDINALIRQYGHSKRLVRLKGGDPFVFGRGGEEAQECARNGIPFEVVPGISSVYAVPMYAGIPVSHRDFNSSFAVLTGHESEKEESAVDWEHLPENLVVLMGVKNIKDTARKLLDTGRAPSTPVAAIFKGTTPEQRTEMTDLGRLAEEGIELDPPVVFVIGPVASLHDELAWFEKKLERARGKKVVLTRAKTHQDESVRLLESFGMEVISMPLIEIVPREFELPALTEFDALVFTSLEGVKRVGEKANLRDFKGSVFAIGPRTKEHLEIGFALKASMGKTYNSEGLAEHILSRLGKGNKLEGNKLKSSKILALRSSAATGLLRDKLSKKFEVTEIPVYDIKRLPADPEMIEKGDAVFVVSASCAKSISKLDRKHLENKVLVSIGPETSRHLPYHLPYPHITASAHTIQGMIDVYLNYLWTGFP